MEQKIEQTIEARHPFLMDMINCWTSGRKLPEAVVMVLPRPGGKVLLMIKACYPSGAYRLPSGGIDKGETPENTFLRETREETGLSVPISRKLAEITFNFAHDGTTTVFRCHVFLGLESNHPVHPEDESEEITDFIEIPIADLPTVAENLRNLPLDWSDWGEFRAVEHIVTFDALMKEINK